MCPLFGNVHAAPKKAVSMIQCCAGKQILVACPVGQSTIDPRSGNHHRITQDCLPLIGVSSEGLGHHHHCCVTWNGLSIQSSPVHACLVKDLAQNNPAYKCQRLRAEPVGVFNCSFIPALIRLFVYLFVLCRTCKGWYEAVAGWSS